jgi:carboxyl-terminal processing protease
MKSKLFLTISILAAGLIFSSWTFSVMDNKESLLIRLMMQGLSQNHYKEVAIDDTFSEEAFEMYLKRLDYNKRYFIKDDIEKMGRYQSQIDDEVNNGTYQLLDLSVSLITERIKEAESYVESILSKPFDFDKKESINLDSEELSYAKSKAALKERWRKLLKYQTMVRLHDLLEDQEKKIEKGKKSKMAPKVWKSWRRKLVSG